jgi:hypothetical protein
MEQLHKLNLVDEVSTCQIYNIHLRILTADDTNMRQETCQATSLYQTISFGRKINCGYILFKYLFGNLRRY